MSNLLDKASIILTPTAYNNGEALCVKPSDGSGDFDFSRNSAATRVNAQGLVENVQILSSNLVQNGDFSEEGAEEVSNGSFTNGSTDWTLDSGCSITEQGLRIVSSGEIQDAIQNSVVTIGKYYKIQYEITEAVSGSLKIVGTFGVNLSIDSTVGVHTFYATGVDPNLNIRRNASPTDITITNISVKEVGQNWNLGTGWSIGDDKVIATSVSNQFVTQSFNFTSGKRYRASFSVTGTSSLPNNASLRLPYDGDVSNIAYVNQNSDGVYSHEFISNGSSTLYLGYGSFTGTITNISVIEITTDTNLPRINYEGFSYQDALGSEEVVNGGFATDSDWVKGTGWSISGGVSTANNVPNLQRLQNTGNAPSVIGSTYKYSIDVSNVSGFYSFYVFGVYALSTVNTEGTIEGYVTATSTNGAIFVAAASAGGLISATIDNVSVKEYLGQEVVPDSGCGSWLFEPQSTNLITYSEDFSDSSWAKTNCTINSNNAISPDGTQNADKLDFTTSNGEIVRTTTGFVVGQEYTMSFYAKTESGTLDFIYGNMDYSTISGTATNEWQRFVITQTLPTTTRYPKIQTTEIGSLLLWGFQVEQQSYATSYIPTEGTQKTRNQDVCTNGGSLASINSTSGTLYFEGAALADDGSTRRLSLSDGTNNNRVFIGYSAVNTIQFVVQSLGVISVNQTFTITDITQFSKIAFKYKENDCSFWIDGVEVGTDTIAAMPIGLNQVVFAQGDVARPFFGKTKALAVWKEALSDQELTELTTI